MARHCHSLTQLSFSAQPALTPSLLLSILSASSPSLRKLELRQLFEAEEYAEPSDLTDSASSSSVSSDSVWISVSSLCPHLELLTLENVPLSVQGFSSLGRISSLHSLIISSQQIGDLPAINDSHIIAVSQIISESSQPLPLTSLTILSQFSISDFSLTHLLPCLPHLQELKIIESGDAVTAAAILSLLSHCPHLGLSICKVLDMITINQLQHRCCLHWLVTAHTWRNCIYSLLLFYPCKPSTQYLHYILFSSYLLIFFVPLDCRSSSSPPEPRMALFRI